MSGLGCGDAKGELDCDVAAGVDELFSPENNEVELADGVGVAPPKRLAVGLAEDISAGLAGCCPKSELVAVGVAADVAADAAALFCVVVGFAPRKLEAEELSAGF